MFDFDFDFLTKLKDIKTIFNLEPSNNLISQASNFISQVLQASIWQILKNVKKINYQKSYKRKASITKTNLFILHNSSYSVVNQVI